MLSKKLFHAKNSPGEAEHWLQDDQDENTQSFGQHGPEQRIVDVKDAQLRPLQLGLVMILRLLTRCPVLSQAALQLPHGPQVPKTQFTGQHLKRKKQRFELKILSMSSII